MYLKNLKSDYRAVKDHNGETGRGRKSCKFYSQLDGILGLRPASAPSVLVDTGISSNVANEPQGSEEEIESQGNIAVHSEFIK